MIEIVILTVSVEVIVDDENPSVVVEVTVESTFVGAFVILITMEQASFQRAVLEGQNV